MSGRAPNVVAMACVWGPGRPATIHPGAGVGSAEDLPEPGKSMGARGGSPPAGTGAATASPAERWTTHASNIAARARRKAVKRDATNNPPLTFPQPLYF